MRRFPKQNLVGLVLWATAMVAPGEPPSPVPGKAGAPPYTVTETEIKLPGVTISRATREVRIEATACLESGILEYVVCRPDTFEHEAGVFSLRLIQTEGAPGVSIYPVPLEALESKGLAALDRAERHASHRHQKAVDAECQVTQCTQPTLQTSRFPPRTPHLFTSA